MKDVHSLVKVAFVTALFCAATAQIATGSAIVYQGQNPAVFPGANPGNQAALLSSVDRPSDPSSANSLSSQLTPAYIVQQSVLGNISAQINNTIFNSAAASGTFDLGGGNLISFVRGTTTITINITDPVNGTTQITLPNVAPR